MLVDLVFDYSDELASKYELVQRGDHRITAEAHLPLNDKHFLGSAGPLFDSDGKLAGAIETIRGHQPRQERGT